MAVGRGSWVVWVIGQLCDGSRGSWVTKDDPFPSLVLTTLCPFAVSESEAAVAEATRMLRDAQTLLALSVSSFKQVSTTQ